MNEAMPEIRFDIPKTLDTLLTPNKSIITTDIRHTNAPEIQIHSVLGQRLGH